MARPEPKERELGLTYSEGGMSSVRVPRNQIVPSKKKEIRKKKLETHKGIVGTQILFSKSPVKRQVGGGVRRVPRAAERKVFHLIVGEGRRRGGDGP